MQRSLKGTRRESSNKWTNDEVATSEGWIELNVWELVNSAQGITAGAIPCRSCDVAFLSAWIIEALEPRRLLSVLLACNSISVTVAPVARNTFVNAPILRAAPPRASSTLFATLSKVPSRAPNAALRPENPYQERAVSTKIVATTRYLVRENLLHRRSRGLLDYQKTPNHQTGQLQTDIFFDTNPVRPI